MKFTLRHYKACGTSPTVCSRASCASDGMIFQMPAVSGLTAPTASISAKDGSSNNKIGSQDGSITFTIQATDDFPVYGGQI